MCVNIIVYKQSDYHQMLHKCLYYFHGRRTCGLKKSQLPLYKYNSRATQSFNRRDRRYICTFLFWLLGMLERSWIWFLALQTLVKFGKDSLRNYDIVSRRTEKQTFAFLIWIHIQMWVCDISLWEFETILPVCRYAVWLSLISITSEKNQRIVET